MTLRWLIASRRATALDLSRAPTLARVSYVQLAILVVMMFLATAIARGIRP